MQFNEQLTKKVQIIIETIIQMRSPMPDLKSADKNLVKLVEYTKSSTNDLNILRIWPTLEFDKYINLSPYQKIQFWRSSKLYKIIINPNEKFYREIDPSVIENFKNLFKDYKEPQYSNSEIKKSPNIFIYGILAIGIYLMVGK